MSEIDPQFECGAGDKLSKAMRKLAANSQQGAPAEIGIGLAMTFRRHHARRRRIHRMSIAGLVTCAMAITGLFFLRTSHPEPGTTQAHVEPVNLPARPPEVTQSASAPRQMPKIASRHTQPRVTTSTVEYSREFIALPGYDPEMPAEDLHIVRVQLPTSTLWQMGAPINPAAPERRVLADFVISQDGTPYGVRLVQ